MQEQFLRVPYYHLIKKKLNICNIQLSESEEYDIWWILFDVFVVKGFTVQLNISKRLSNYKEIIILFGKHFRI